MTDGEILYDELSTTFAWLWFVIFVSFTFESTVLLILRRDQHPLKARSPALLVITAVGASGLAIWTAIGQMGVDLSCNAAHWMQNIFYPMFILPYFLRARRVVIIFTEARRFHRETLANTERIDQEKHSHFGSFIDDCYNNKGKERLSLSITSVSPRSSNSLLIVNEEPSAWDFEEDQLRKMKGAIADWANQATLLRWFAIYMIPFVVLSVIDTIFKGGTHLLPSISASTGDGVSGKCDMTSIAMKVTTILLWIIIHTLEASVFAYYYRKLSTVLKEFHTQQEFALIFAAEILYTLIFIVLLILIANMNLDEVDHSVEYVVMSRSAYFVCVTILWPTYSTYFGTQAPKFPNRSVLKSLHNVLQDPLALKYFYNYLHNDETSSTLLQFWMEVDMFRENVDDCQNMGKLPDFSVVRKLFYTYFEPSTDNKECFLANPDSLRHREVMARIIPRRIVDEMLTEINRCECEGLTCGEDVFGDAKFIAFKLLENDYRLFLRSKECKDLLYHLDGQ